MTKKIVNKKALIIFGTRPEAIKLAPIVRMMQASKGTFSVTVCSTGQHKEMLEQVLDFFQIVPDYSLKVMRTGQDLFGLTNSLLRKIKMVIEETLPDVVFVQGDTTTAFVGALAAYYLNVPVAHVEAGLRTGDLYAPFPEEANRKFITCISRYNFAPTYEACEFLRKENVQEKQIFLTGNTVTDAALFTAKIVDRNDKEYTEKFASIDFSKKLILITAHRRENLGAGIENICKAVAQLAQDFPIEIIFPVHLNPLVQKPVHLILDGISNVHLLEPLSYPETIWFMRRSYLIMTDSGGIQEEAPSLGKPVIVLRDKTERHEGVKAGTAILAGISKEKIYRIAADLLTNENNCYEKMSTAVNPYGDGHCSERILKVIENM